MLQIETAQPGWKVYDDHGDEFGEVVEASTNWLRIKHGGLLGAKHYYVPASAVANMEEHQVYLNVGKDAATQWGDKPPEGTSA